MIEFRINPPDEKRDQVTILQGQLEISSALAQTPIPPIPFNISLAIKESPTPEPPPAAIIQAISKLTLYRIQEKARAEVTAGEYDKASNHLQKLATHLLAQGERGLAHTIMLEVEHIEKEKSFTESGEKKIKYGTRALVRPEERTL